MMRYHEHTYDVYRHPDDDCTVLDDFLSYHEDRPEEYVEEGRCYLCNVELEHIETQTVSAIPPEPGYMMKEFIDEMSDETRAVFLAMCMESVRGNWSQLKDRLGIIKYICDGIDEELVPSAEFVNDIHNKVGILMRRQRARAQYPDGRIFRGQGSGCYGSLWEHLGGRGEHVDLIEELAPFIPNDMTWEDHRFERLRGES